MAKIIFTSGINSEYDDIPEIRCEFPQRYLKAVEGAIGDWAIYYEPRKNGGRMSYYASARVDRIEEHPTISGSYYMFVSDYLEFTHPVRFKEESYFYESSLKREDGMPNQGMLGWSVRRLPEEEFTAILQSGFGNSPFVNSSSDLEVAEEQASYNRPINQQLVNRPFRDIAFRKNIHSAYDETCAFTGMRLSDGKNKFEVEAAHIRAVENDGPDSRRNGLALGRTIHWLFDKGVLSLENDGRILKADRLVPDHVSSLLHADGYAIFPEENIKRPHPQFLRYHRENRFIG